jgi:hypothetical protein
MTYETYRLIFLVGAIAAGLMVIAAVVLFFVLQIPRVIGDLTGSTARKAIAGIRSQTEQNGGRDRKRTEHSPAHADSPASTQKLSRNDAAGNRADAAPKAQQAPLAEETTLLAPETTLLSPETTLLSLETTVLASQGASVSTAPGETTRLQPAAQAQPTTDFVIEQELTYLHTDEVLS